MTWLSLLATSDEIPIPIQLGIAIPFALALAFIGKWLLKRLESESQLNRDMTQQLIDKVVPALTQSTLVLKEAADLIRDLSAEGRRRGTRDDL